MATLTGGLGHVLVLNASYEPLNVCSVRRAHVLVFKGKAEVLEEHELPLHSATTTFPRPHVIRLVTYVRVPRAAQRKISRRALFARDGWSCVYCGTSGGRLTLDHVVPRSRGGNHEWANVVSACRRCNHVKADRTVSDLGWRMQPPREPVGTAWRILSTGRSDPRWAPYLSAYGGDLSVATA
jgi:5-methylcytosine-specific restriction endonuclease McrA